MVKSFAQAFSKACRFLRQRPTSLSAESEIFLRSQSQEGKTKLPVDVSSEGNPTKGFPERRSKPPLKNRLILSNPRNRPVERAQVLVNPHIAQTGGFKQRLYRLPLRLTDFHGKHAVRVQFLRPNIADRAVEDEAVRAAVQRRFRLFLHFALQKRQLACLNIRRVRRDEIEPIRQRLRKRFI